MLVYSYLALASLPAMPSIEIGEPVRVRVAIPVKSCSWCSPEKGKDHYCQCVLHRVDSPFDCGGALERLHRDNEIFYLKNSKLFLEEDILRHVFVKSVQDDMEESETSIEIEEDDDEATGGVRMHTTFDFGPHCTIMYAIVFLSFVGLSRRLEPFFASRDAGKKRFFSRVNSRGRHAKHLDVSKYAKHAEKQDTLTIAKKVKALSLITTHKMCNHYAIPQFAQESAHLEQAHHEQENAHCAQKDAHCAQKDALWSAVNNNYNRRKEWSKSRRWSVC